MNINVEQYTRTSFSQVGEDLILEFIFSDFLAVKNPNYLDIGANHPVKLSNTYNFYLKGSRGVIVEPNPSLIELAQQIRGEDICLNAAINLDGKSEVDFFLMNPNTLSTIDAKTAHEFQSNGRAKIERIIRVPAFAINHIIETYLPQGVDLINIDTEGIELEILKTLNFEKHRPKVVLAETWEIDQNGRGSKNVELINFMLKKNYVVIADTLLNTIFLARR